MKFYGNESNPDISTLPGWELCTNEIKEKIYKAALQYINEEDDRRKKWFCKDKIHSSDLAGYKAFILLLQYKSEIIDTLTPEIWNNWAVIILGYPPFMKKIGEKNIKKIEQILIHKLYTLLPGVVYDLILDLITYENTKGHLLAGLRRIFWSGPGFNLFLEISRSQAEACAGA